MMVENGEVVAWVPGRPVPLARGRAFWDANVQGVRVADSKKNSEFKKSLGWAVKPLFGGKPFEGPVEVKLAVCVAGRRGDLDNYIKAVFDALNRIAWHDDAQVVKIEAEFRLCDPSGQGVGITVTKRTERG
jgi:Holliday junction resolvase RusA-like endonuclease